MKSDPTPSEVIHHEGRLYHLGIAPGEVARRIVLVGDPARARRVATRFDAVEHEVVNREYVTLTGRIDGQRVSAVGTGIGTDNVEIALVELHAAHAIELESGLPKPEAPTLDFVRVGTSGGVQPDLPAGTLCLAEYALGLDSTAFYYDAPPQDEVVRELERASSRTLSEAITPGSRFAGAVRPYASKAHPEILAALQAQAQRLGHPAETGVTASAPSFFGASSRTIAGLVNSFDDIKGALARIEASGRKILNVEMESSLLFHLAGALGHRAGTICTAISQPASQGAVIDYGERIEAAIDVALAALLQPGDDG